MPRTKKCKLGSARRRAEKEAREKASKVADVLEAKRNAPQEKVEQEAGEEASNMLDMLEAEINAQQEKESGKRDEAVEQAAGADAFKSSLERFKHGATTILPAESENDGTAAYRNNRKRPLTDKDADATPANTPPSKKKQKQSSKYISKLSDILEPGLICVFVGTNPGIRTATAGHAYAHPTNLFWKLLGRSGCTDIILSPKNDVELPKWYGMGNTNLVERPTKDAASLSMKEKAEGVPVLEQKIRKYRPEAVCIVGKGIYKAIFRYKYKREMKKDEFKWGWQPDSERMGEIKGPNGEVEWEGAPVFVTTSTSGSAATLRPPEKLHIWRPFGEWVKATRKERYGTEGRIDRVPASSADYKSGGATVAKEAEGPRAVHGVSKLKLWNLGAADTEAVAETVDSEARAAKDEEG